MLEAMSRTAVVLDRHRLWAEAVECVLRRVGVDVVGMASSAADAGTLVERLRPDLLVTDVALEDGERAGLDCLRDARRVVPELRAIFLSLSEEVEVIEAALQAGAAAYVLKSAQPEDLASAVRQSFEHSVFTSHPRRASRPVSPALRARRPRARS